MEHNGAAVLPGVCDGRLKVRAVVLASAFNFQKFLEVHIKQKKVLLILYQEKLKALFKQPQENLLKKLLVLENYYPSLINLDLMYFLHQKHLKKVHSMLYKLEPKIIIIKNI